MSTSEFDGSYQSDDSDVNFIPGYVVIEDADHEFTKRDASDEDESTDESVSGMAYSEEPLADEEWLKYYQKAESERLEFEQKLRERFDGSVEIGEWCKCGNCSRNFLSNANESLCCCEIEECGQSLVCEQVLNDVGKDTHLSCITHHPGFNPVCLQKWSLRMAADKYKTKSKTKYSQMDSEERFMRSISYREFTRLVYGHLGNKRIPLPSCAYTMIRKTFPVGKEEDFTGFIDLD